MLHVTTLSEALTTGRSIFEPNLLLSLFFTILAYSPSIVGSRWHRGSPYVLMGMNHGVGRVEEVRGRRPSRGGVARRVRN